MIFNIGGSKSSSQSQSSSSSNSFDNLDQSSFDFGQTGSTSGGSSSSRSRVAFEDIFSQLFSGASATAAGIDTGAIGGAANMLFGSGMGFLNDLSGGGAGTRFLEDQITGSAGLVDSQIGQLSSDIGEFLSETVNPAIKSSGISASTLGGSRGEVQKGLAAEGALEEFVRGTTAIRAGERDRLTGIASNLASNQMARSQSALGFLPGLFGLAESGAMAGLSPFAALSQILGGPTVLTDSDSINFADAFGINLGGSTTRGRAASSSRSQSTSSSDSMSFSGGLG